MPVRSRSSGSSIPYSRNCPGARKTYRSRVALEEGRRRLAREEAALEAEASLVVDGRDQRRRAQDAPPAEDGDRRRVVVLGQDRRLRVGVRAHPVHRVRQRRQGWAPGSPWRWDRFAGGSHQARTPPAIATSTTRATGKARRDEAQSRSAIRRARVRGTGQRRRDVVEPGRRRRAGGRDGRGPARPRRRRSRPARGPAPALRPRRRARRRRDRACAAARGCPPRAGRAGRT